MFIQKGLKANYVNKGQASKSLIKNSNELVYDVVFGIFQMHGDEGAESGLSTKVKGTPTELSTISEGAKCVRHDNTYAPHLSSRSGGRHGKSNPAPGIKQEEKPQQSGQTGIDKQPKSGKAETPKPGSEKSGTKRSISGKEVVDPLNKAQWVEKCVLLLSRTNSTVVCTTRNQAPRPSGILER